MRWRLRFQIFIEFAQKKTHFVSANLVSIPWCQAVVDENVPMVKALLAHPQADVLVKHEEGPGVFGFVFVSNTPLRYAQKNCGHEIVGLLEAQGQ